MKANKPMLIRLSKPISDKLEKISDETGCMKSQIVKMALSEYLANHLVNAHD
jgi:predicted DNA-binding protein